MPLGTFSRNELSSEGYDPCAVAAVGGPCLSLSPTMPLFERVAYNIASDSRGGLPQNSYLHLTRFDCLLNDTTQIYGRYALHSNDFFLAATAMRVSTQVSNRQRHSQAEPTPESSLR